jgi:tyrosyl-tRNA synthetase
VWLDAARTSPYELYQYFVNVTDADLRNYLLRLTLLPVAEVDEIMVAHAAAPEQRVGHRRLASELTALVHGDDAAAEAQAASRSFARSAGDLTAGEFALLADELPTTELAGAEVVGADLVDLVVRTGLETSKGAARRTLDGGGLYVNDAQASPGRILEAADIRHDRYVLLRKGKRTRHLVLVT